MNHAPRTTHHAPRIASLGFTIVEMLVVISIIAILASMIVPAISKARIKAQVKQAQMEMGQIINAIHGYEADNNKFPVTRGAMLCGTNGADFTYGTYGVTCAGTPSPTGFKSPGGAYQVLPSNIVTNYQPNNSEIMAVLLDRTNFPGTGLPTCNYGYRMNPRQDSYLNAKMVSDTNSAGVGPDLVYRDPWGNPYIVTIDTGYDGKARDSFYKMNAISHQPGGTGTGFNGLINSVDPVNGAGDYYDCSAPVMIWSAGPDKMIDPTQNAVGGVNKDNVLSWKQ